MNSGGSALHLGWKEHLPGFHVWGYILSFWEEELSCPPSPLSPACSQPLCWPYIYSSLVHIYLKWTQQDVVAPSVPAALRGLFNGPFESTALIFLWWQFFSSNLGSSRKSDIYSQTHELIGGENIYSLLLKRHNWNKVLHSSSINCQKLTNCGKSYETCLYFCFDSTYTNNSFLYPKIFTTTFWSSVIFINPSRLPQLHQAFPEIPQATAVMEAGSLTADCHFSLPSSKFNPSVSSPMSAASHLSWFLLPLFPHSSGSHRSFSPTFLHISPVTPASNSGSHSLGNHLPSLPER